MLVRLTRDSFYRRYGPYGYVTNQLTKKDRVYDEFGAVFVERLGRAPAHIEAMIDDLLGHFVDVERAELAADFHEFLGDLVEEGFAVIGPEVAALDASEPRFTYAVPLPRTARLPTLSSDSVEATRPSEEIMIRYFQEHPTIFGAHVEVTGRCNERCVHCYQGEKTRGHAEVAFIEDLFDQLAALGTANVTLSGGEPTLHPDLPRLLRSARAHDFMINLLTNGMRMGADLLDAITEVNVNVVQVSLYAMDPAVHDAITRVPGAHARTLQTLHALLARDIPLQISCPLMKPNQGAYPAVARWCREHKVRVLSDFILTAQVDFDTSNLAHRLDLTQTRRVLEDIWEFDDEYRLLVEQPDPFVDDRDFVAQPVCGVCIDNVCFAADGSLYPCSGFSGYSLGNAHEAPVREIWERSERAQYLRQLRNGAFPACVGCASRAYCIRCLARNFNESGGDMLHLVDHYCQVAHLNREVVARARAQERRP